MKIVEVLNSANQKLKNIKDILSMSNNENLLNFVEKKINNINTQEAIMTKEQRIDAIIKALQESNDNQAIDSIETFLKKTELESRVEKLWSKRNFNTGRMSKYKENFKSTIIQAPSPLISKIELLYILTSNKTAITKDLFTKSFKKSIDDIVPEKIKNNNTFQAIKNTLFFADTFRGKGIGPAEFALSLLGSKSNIVDHKGDIVIDGWGIEIKDGGGGSIKTGSPNSFRKSDQIRDWIGNQVGVSLDKINKLKWDSTNEFTEKFNSLDQKQKQNITVRYVDELYPNLGNDEKSIIISGIIADAGKPQVRLHFGKALLSSYKLQDEWDSILFINKKGIIVNVVDVEDSTELLDFQLAGINRDGDTQALPDGYVNGKIK
jgi:hypothetical protein